MRKKLLFKPTTSEVEIQVDLKSAFNVSGGNPYIYTDGDLGDNEYIRVHKIHSDGSNSPIYQAGLPVQLDSDNNFISIISETELVFKKSLTALPVGLYYGW